MKRVIIITGPTASGKTELSIEIAKRINGEIISADSMQIYREMNIGTAKPTEAEMQGIPHYMIDEVSIGTPYSVALYQKKAFECIEDILSRGKTPIVVGGTGLYINSLLYNLDFTKTTKNDKLRTELETLPSEELHRKLKELDETAAQRIHPNDKKRIIRRIEILKSGIKEDYNFREKNTSYDFLVIGIWMDRKELYERTDRRVDIMIGRGLAREVAEIYKKYPVNLIALQAIGYKEIIEYLEGRCTLAGAIDNIKKNTRRFAKRQLTWFNNEERLIWFDKNRYQNTEEMLYDIIKKISSNK
jgi:tRNA dimethylallyltransferase